MNSQKQQKYRLLATSLASPFASMISKFILHPIDTIKSKVQISTIKWQNLSDYKPGTVFKLSKQTFQNEGIKGFFRGVTLSVFGSAIAFTFYMTVYEHSKKMLSTHPFFEKHPTFSHLVSGFLAQVVSCSIWLPIDIVKQRLQVQSQVKIYSYSGPRQALQKINLSQGLIGLYRAFGATLLFFGPFSAIFFACYEFLKEKVVQKQGIPTMRQAIICSAGASSIAGYLVTPLELVKLRMQIQRADVANRKKDGISGASLENSIFGYRNSFHGLYSIWKNEGAYALYRGAVIRVAFTVPMTTLTISLTQYFKQLILQKKQMLDAFI